MLVLSEGLKVGTGPSVLATFAVNAPFTFRQRCNQSLLGLKDLYPNNQSQENPFPFHFS